MSFATKLWINHRQFRLYKTFAERGAKISVDLIVGSETGLIFAYRAVLRCNRTEIRTQGGQRPSIEVMRRWGNAMGRDWAVVWCPSRRSRSRKHQVVHLNDQRQLGRDSYWWLCQSQSGFRKRGCPLGSYVFPFRYLPAFITQFFCVLVIFFLTVFANSLNNA